MKKFQVSIQGLVPLLQARHLTPNEEEEITNLKQSKQKKRDVTDKEQFDVHAYKNKSGKFYQPSEMIEAAMAKAAVNFKMEGKKSYKDVIKGGIIVNPIEILHKNQAVDLNLKSSDGGSAKAKGWYVDDRWGKNPNTRGAVWVVRPRIDEWQLDFSIDLLQDERVSAQTLKDILAYAGLYVGIGAWRPKFGRFEITAFKEV